MKMSVENAVRSYSIGLSATFHAFRWVNSTDPFGSSILGFVIETLDTTKIVHDAYHYKLLETPKRRNVVVFAATTLIALHGLSYYPSAQKWSAISSVRTHLPLIKSIVVASFIFNKPFSKHENIFCGLGVIAYSVRQWKTTPPLVIKGLNIVAFLKAGANLYFGSWFERVNTITFLFINFYLVPKLKPS